MIIEIIQFQGKWFTKIFSLEGVSSAFASLTHLIPFIIWRHAQDFELLSSSSFIHGPGTILRYLWISALKYHEIGLYNINEVSNRRS